MPESRSLYTLSEMKQADKILSEVYKKQMQTIIINVLIIPGHTGSIKKCRQRLLIGLING